ncbi:MAG: histidine kinase, partial [Allopontixanthobacter sediminis]
MGADDSQPDRPRIDQSATIAAPHTGSLSRRMMLIAAGWISVLLLAGGWALDRTLTNLVEDNFDSQLGYLLNTMIVVSEIGPD